MLNAVAGHLGESRSPTVSLIQSTSSIYHFQNVLHSRESLSDGFNFAWLPT